MDGLWLWDRSSRKFSSQGQKSSQSRTNCSVRYVFLVSLSWTMAILFLVSFLVILSISFTGANSLKDDCSCEILNKPSLWHKEETARYVGNQTMICFIIPRWWLHWPFHRTLLFHPDGWSILLIGASFQLFRLALCNLWTANGSLQQWWQQ